MLREKRGLARQIADAIIYFLERFAVRQFVEPEFLAVLGEAEGGFARFSRLVAACGFGDDAEGFCAALAWRLDEVEGVGAAKVEFNGVVLPYLLISAVYEILMPGESFTSVRSVGQLEALTRTTVPKAERKALQAVLDRYPVRLSTYVIRQMRASASVAYQYMPFAAELDATGHDHTWVGQFHQGLVERMYRNRVIFLLNMTCPVYCRFCFRKHKAARAEANPTRADVELAVDYVRTDSNIREILITGGDPFMNRKNLEAAIDGLADIPHVRTLRLATRSIAYYPHLFFTGKVSLLDYLKSKNSELRTRGKRMEIGTHFIHPDEISIKSLEIITELVRSGIVVYVQTPFLKDCNDQGPELASLFNLLRGAGAEFHYIFIPCSPIRGNTVYWTPISRGLAAARYLRAHLSDRAVPRICTATPIGKIDWFASGWAVEPDPDNSRYVWLRTPYTPDYFTPFATLNDTGNLRLNDEGTFDVRYMADIGDERLFIGSRKPFAKAPNSSAAVSQTVEPGDIAALSERLANDIRDMSGIVSTGRNGVHRLHKTRVQIDPEFADEGIAYLMENPAITDVIVDGNADPADDGLPSADRLIRRLWGVETVNAVRLRSMAFLFRPERFMPMVLEQLAHLNRVTVVNPTRLEIETWFLHSSQIRPEHGLLTSRLSDAGITVYANVPLLADVNDTPDEISRLARKFREAGVEFHHLYTAGLPLQRNWKRPMDVGRVIDIGSRLRMDGSGREIPRYMIATALGEVDFGLTGRFVKQEGGLSVRLFSYDLSYYREIGPEFTWPPDVTCGEGGSPVVPVEGLIDAEGFFSG